MKMFSGENREMASGTKVGLQTGALWTHWLYLRVHALLQPSTHCQLVAWHVSCSFSNVCSFHRPLSHRCCVISDSRTVN